MYCVPLYTTQLTPIFHSQRPYVFTPKTLCLCPKHPMFLPQTPLLHITAPFLPFPSHIKATISPHIRAQTLPLIVVGYNTKAAHGGLNWYTASFLTVGANTIDINTITLDDGNIGTEDQMVGWGDPMQIVNPNGNPLKVYNFWDPSMDPNEKATTFYWGDDECNPVTVSFDPADGIGIENGSTSDFTVYDIRNSGQVPTENVRFAAHGGLNWSGNPFSAPISINAITLDDGNIGTEDQMVGWGDPMQIVNPNGNPLKVYNFWDPSMDPNEKATTFYWGDGECNPVEKTFEPGEGFAIENGSTGDYIEYDIKIACPYSL